MSIVVQKFLNIPLEYLGAVPMDEQIAKAVMRQKPISVTHPEAPSAKAIKDITDKLMKIEKEQERRGISQFFSNLIRSKMSKANK